MKKRVAAIICIFVILFAVVGQVAASAAAYAPYYSYEYNSYDQSVAAPVGYIPSNTITAESLGLEIPFNSPNDICYDNKDTLYILDSSNSRIIAINKSLNLKKEYSKITDEAGNIIQFAGAEGIAVGADDTIYIADTMNKRILLINQQGKVFHIITRPDEALKNTGAAFDPSKILLDKQGKIYVIAKSINLGILVFSSQGEFIQYWGAAEVPTTGQALFNYFRKRFLTKAQLKLFKQTTPVVVSNFDIDKSGFIYTISPYKTQATVAMPGLLRKLNFKAEDILNPTIIFGDTEWDRKPYPDALKSWFIDVDIDDEGFINLLDPPRGKIFQYTDSGQLVAVFGALGDQAGCFSAPKAIESIGKKIYVSDIKKNCIYEFYPTAYAQSFRSALIKLNNYDLSGSFEQWNIILNKNSNSKYAYQGIGRVYDIMGDYKNAMKYFRISGSREEYSKSFEQYRNIFMEQNYLWLLLGIFLLIVVVVMIARLIAKYSVALEGKAYSRLEEKYLFPVFTMFHPADGFAQFKFRKNASLKLSIGIIALWFFGEATRYFWTGIPFNTNILSDYNPFITLMQTAGIYALFVVANWAVCTLTEGKGTFKDIVATVSYSLVPYIMSIYISVGISNFLISDEKVYLELISSIGIIWSLFILFSGLFTIHQYSFLKTIFTIISTLFGMLIIVFLIILLYGLLEQAWNFLVSVYKEGVLRFRL